MVVSICVDKAWQFITTEITVLYSVENSEVYEDVLAAGFTVNLL